MEKYGVVQDDKKTGEKTASGTELCPKCGSEIKGGKSVQKHCPNCGTEPWEKKDGR